jgi:predicted amidohydrolase
VNGQTPAPGIRANLAHMLELIDKVQGFGGTKDLLCFHEFPLQGWNPWDRKELERIAITIPGPETEAIAAKARQYNCYIQFGAYAVDKDWPGHILSITSIIGPTGELVARDWKARNIVGVFPGFELVTTTIYNALDRFVEMYGVDAVIPVHRTDIGNLATSSTQLEPELFRAMALKGAELLLRTASGDQRRRCAHDIDVQPRVSVINNSVSPDNPGFLDDPGWVRWY